MMSFMAMLLLMTGGRFCAHCGSFGHETKDCPWLDDNELGKAVQDNTREGKPK